MAGSSSGAAPWWWSRPRRARARPRSATRCARWCPTSTTRCPAPPAPPRTGEVNGDRLPLPRPRRSSSPCATATSSPSGRRARPLLRHARAGRSKARSPAGWTSSSTSTRSGARQLRARATRRRCRCSSWPPRWPSWTRGCASARATRRARSRGGMSRARDEIAAWREYDYLIINRDVKEAVDQLATIIQAERCRTSRLTLRFPDVEVPD